MKAVKSFEVMESFGMNGLTSEELMNVEGGGDVILFGCKCNGATYTDNSTDNSSHENNTNVSDNNVTVTPPSCSTKEAMDRYYEHH